jgi:hypothetical protein
MHGPMWRMLLGVGWIFFMIAVAGPAPCNLEWRDDVITLFPGPVLMIAGLILRYRSSSHHPR